MASRKVAKRSYRLAGARRSQRRRSGLKKVAWAAPFIAAGVTAFITAVGTDFGHSTVNAITNSGEPGAASGTDSGNKTGNAITSPGGPLNAITNPSGAGGLPAAIDLVTLAPAFGNSTYALPNRFQLTSAQLTQLNANAATGDKTWFAAQHAVIAGPATVTVVVEGNRSGTVRIMGIEPVPSCHPPLAGTLFYSPSQGVDTSIELHVTLDGANPRVTARDGSDFFTAHTVSLAHGEQETFVIAAQALREYCSFTFDMTVLDGTKTVTETIGNPGQPFTITALDQQGSGPVYGAYQTMYIGGLASAARGLGTNWAQVDPLTYPSR